MKLKSLILGSVAAAGLSTGAYAADLGVLTSLDVCDALGLSGLTISSDTNCLQITGSVEYKFVWGDYLGEDDVGQPIATTPAGIFAIPLAGGVVDDDGVLREQDWQSYVEAYVKFVATADSDFGPAKAVLKIRQIVDRQIANETSGPLDNDDTSEMQFNEAYVSIGDSTVIMAGKKGTIANFGDDAPFNWLGLFNSEKTDEGVDWDQAATDTILTGLSPSNLDNGGHVIQVVSDLGNGVSVGVGLENLDDLIEGPVSAAGVKDDGRWAGTAVGVLSYAGEGLSAHVSLLAGGVLDGTVDAYAIHAGFTGTFEQFRVRGAFAATHVAAYFGEEAYTNWQALGSAEATFDMFKLAISGEAQSTHDNAPLAGSQIGSYGVGASATATVTDGVTINLGARWFDQDSSVSDTEGYQVAASLSAAVTETLTLTGEIGVYGENVGVDESVYYGAAQVAWAPGGGFTSSLKGEAYSNGAYKATFKAAKSFE